MIGRKFHRLTIIADGPKHPKKKLVVCRCDCGVEKIVSQNALIAGETKSCGCWRRERRFNYKHGGKCQGKETPTYNSWRCMRSRCTNPSDTSFPRYGGRGIRICRRWMSSFENFLADMGERPAGKSLDRKNNDGDYSPRNCRWATPAEQNREQRKLSMVEARKIRSLLGKMSQRKIGAKFGVSQSCVSNIAIGRGPTWSTL